MKIAAALIVLAGTHAFMSSQTFDFKDPKGVNSIGISIDAPLEPVRGHTTGVSGNITFDPEHPEKSTGSIVVDTSKIQVGSVDMTGAMLQDWCLDAPKYPTISFEISKIKSVKKLKDGQWDATVDGTLKVKNVSKPLTVTATVALLPNKIKDRGGMEGKQGDLLQIKSKFSFNRLDFGVAPDLSTNLIGNKIDIDLAVIGVCPK